MESAAWAAVDGIATNEQLALLETDAPDIAPAWLHPQRNSPEELPHIGRVLAELRNMPINVLAQITSENARSALPRLAEL